MVSPPWCVQYRHGQGGEEGGRQGGYLPEADAGRDLHSGGSGRSYNSSVSPLLRGVPCAMHDRLNKGDDSDKTG